MAGLARRSTDRFWKFSELIQGETQTRRSSGKGDRPPAAGAACCPHSEDEGPDGPSQHQTPNGAPRRKGDRPPAGAPQRSEGNSTEDEGADAPSKRKPLPRTKARMRLRNTKPQTARRAARATARPQRGQLAARLARTKARMGLRNTSYAALSIPRSESLRYSVERPIPRRRATSVMRPR